MERENVTFLHHMQAHSFLFLEETMRKESEFQAKLIQKLRKSDWVIQVIKNDPNYIQGFPDLTVFLKNGKWALLECKREEGASRQPNQEIYISWFGECGFARFIYPENEEEVLSDLCQYASRPGRKARTAGSK
jgi:hypothetical protein